MPITDSRLLAIAGLVREGARVADVGTDHGYLIAHLAEAKGVSGIACDINPGPLERARRTIESRGLGTLIETRLCDGLADVSPGEVDDIVIAGMGGYLIADIIAGAPWLADSSKHLILQPMTKAEVLREHLYKNGYIIERERAVLAKQRAYTVILAVYNGQAGTPPDPLWLLCSQNLEGERLAQAAYLSATKKRLEQQLHGLRATAPGSQQERELSEVYRRHCARIEEVMV